ncbi:MAG TPA: M48 family metallopeptidase [Bacilli bacterium]|nr:M48 family metallopeptidase [Bacilli bacterium]
MRIKEATISINNRLYKVNITHKLIKNIYLRFRNDTFYVSAPPVATKNLIFQIIIQSGENLIARTEKKLSLNQVANYLFGKKIERDLSEEEKKDRLLAYLAVKVPFFEKKMNIAPFYKIRVRSMRKLAGSNSRASHTLTFASFLVHYDYAIIDSIIIHELAHYYEFNHGPHFYQIIYKYMPDYHRLSKQMKKGIYHDARNENYI